METIHKHVRASVARDLQVECARYFVLTY
uniref:Uncharacterized protein n=1 Tax=Anguilla anguilla TaxID=7936 RepID=A0A0E9S6A1_ANGAN